MIIELLLVVCIVLIMGKYSTSVLRCVKGVLSPVYTLAPRLPRAHNTPIRTRHYDETTETWYFSVVDIILSQIF